MKKATKKVQDTGAVKVIPPYPRWVKICFTLVWLFLVFGIVVVDITKHSGWDLLSKMLVGLPLLPMLIVTGYGIYRAFRYFSKRAICFLILSLVICGCTIPSFGGQFICLVCICLFIGQGLISLFWKQARKLGCFIFYAIFIIIPLLGQIYSYVTRGPLHGLYIPEPCGPYHRCVQCPPDKPIGLNNCDYRVSGTEILDTLCLHSECTGCNDLNGLTISKGLEKWFKICPNRENVAIGNGCYRSQLKECPEGFIRAENGDCVKRQ